MIKKLKLIHNNPEKENTISLYPHITDALFEHRRYIKNIFLQIKGHYDIAHFSVNIINPSNELISFSSMPHIEYNLIRQGLWKYDPCFSSKTLSKNTLIWWDSISEENLFLEQIKEIKLSSNHFTLGMTLAREISRFNFLYSYATNSTKKNLKEYYNAHIFGLIDIGDYFCKSILNIYSEYCGHYSVPPLNQSHSKAPTPNLRSRLQLVVSNV